jgi:hypothetical protein
VTAPIHALFERQDRQHAEYDDAAVLQNSRTPWGGFGLWISITRARSDTGA